jgi:hypothetical protein
MRPTTVHILLSVSKQKPSSSVSTVSDYRLDNQQSGFDPRQGQSIFPVTSVSRPALRPIQPPVQWVLVVLSLGCDADHSPPSSAEVENKYELYLLSPQAPLWSVVKQL